MSDRVSVLVADVYVAEFAKGQAQLRLLFQEDGKIRRRSTMWINQLRLPATRPRVAQPSR